MPRRPDIILGRNVWSPAPATSSTGAPNPTRSRKPIRARLYQEIGLMKVELDWLRKSMSCFLEQRRQWIQPQNARLSSAFVSGIMLSQKALLPKLAHSWRPD